MPVWKRASLRWRRGTRTASRARSTTTTRSKSGNGGNDGLTVPERETQLSLWALASSPFILGTNLTHLNATDLALLKNRAVIAVDQDAIDARRVMSTSSTQIFAKTEKNGDVLVGLFDTGARAESLSVNAASLGLGPGRDYAVDNLWLHQAVSSAGPIKADVPPHGVALFRVSYGPVTPPAFRPGFDAVVPG